MVFVCYRKVVLRRLFLATLEHKILKIIINKLHMSKRIRKCLYEMALCRLVSILEYHHLCITRPVCKRSPGRPLAPPVEQIQRTHTNRSSDYFLFFKQPTKNATFVVNFFEDEKVDPIGETALCVLCPNLFRESPLLKQSNRILCQLFRFRNQIYSISASLI